MRRTRRWFPGWVVLTTCLMAPTTAFAQRPWNVTVTPTLNPLPIGLCSAVQLTVFDASGKEVPRNPLGFRITMADFDMAVSGASVVGRQIDATHFEVCACQGGAPGGAASVTATYPAQSLSVRARVPDVEFQSVAAFSLSPAKGAINPPACVTASTAPARAAPPAAVALPPPVTPPVTKPPASPPAPVRAPGEAIPGATADRRRLYVPGAVTVTLALSANGSWYVPGPVTMALALGAQGSWYAPAPVTVTFGLSATGNWLELKSGRDGPLQQAPSKP